MTSFGSIDTQVAKALFNPAGYQHNVIQTVTVAVG